MKIKRSKVSFIFCIVQFLIMGSAWADGEKVFIANEFSAAVNIIDSNTLKIIKTMPSNISGAQVMAASGKYLYFINSPDVDIYDTSTLAHEGSFDFGGFLTPGFSKAKITIDGAKMYLGVIGWGKEAVSGIFVIDLVKHEKIKVLAENEIISGLIDISTNGQHLYFAKPSSIAVLQTVDDTILREIQVKNNTRIQDIVSGNGNVFFVALNGLSQSQKNKSEILMADAMGKVEKQLELDDAVYRMLFDRNRYLYVLGRTGVFKIDVQKMVVEKNIEILGENIGLTSDGGKIFVSSPGTNEEFIFNAKTDKFLAAIKVGDEPYEIFTY